MKIVLAIYFCLVCTLLSAETIDLSGKWELQLDPQDSGVAARLFEKSFDDTIRLPGTLAEAGKGKALSLKPSLPVIPPENFNPRKGLTFGRSTNYMVEDAVLDHLQPRFSYTGPAWYRREIEIPKSWTNKDVELSLERVMWESRVWVNGQFIGTQNSLTTPHRFDVSPALRPGRNEIVIRVDNRRQLAIGDPHAYTEQSQTIWNGIIGQITLVARNKVRIDGLQLRPDLARHVVEVTVHTHNGSETETPGELSLQAVPENFHGKKSLPLKFPVSLAPGDSVRQISYPMGTNVERWSEFNPKLYRLRAALSGDGFSSEVKEVFGMREFTAAGRELFINGQPVFLRGTVDCCEFPLTGCPDMTDAQWDKIFSTVKKFGLNHMRFHTWCPPEAAFAAADRYGVYLEVELPDWSFKIGADTNVTEFFRAEGGRMIRQYSHHPSWVMFTMGNELKGNYSTLDALETDFRKLDPQLLYASTTYPIHKVPEPADNYYISQDTRAGRARGQDIFENTPPNTETNFAAAISPIPLPFISHEVGQYCVYPNVAEIPKYKGVLEDTALEAIRDDLKAKHRLAEAGTYTRDSGKLAALLYKEEIERALRTTNQAGFQLLQLNDFPGQGTSTVGLLDAFWDSKGLIRPEAFRLFCGPVTPLLLMPKWVYQNDETFDADVEVANFGPGPITNATVAWDIRDDDRKIGSGTFRSACIAMGQGIPVGHLRQSLADVGHPAKLIVTVRIPGTSVINKWPVWVYPAEASVATNAVVVFHSTDAAFYQALQGGKRVLLLPSRENVKSPLAAEFVPVFWNPVMFPNQPSSMGAMIDARHPAFAEFPTEPWTDWQWWELLHNSFAVNLDGLATKVPMPLRFVDKFNRNALSTAIFEARVGSGRLLVCTLDVTHDLDTRIAARQLYRSLLNYAAGDRFQPREQLNPSDLETLFSTSQ